MYYINADHNSNNLCHSSLFCWCTNPRFEEMLQVFTSITFLIGIVKQIDKYHHQAIHKCMNMDQLTSN